jgi:hypothetical protein
LKTADGRYISAAPGGGFELSGSAVSGRTGFIVTDANGGELSDGDEIRIKYTPGYSSDGGKTKPSFWVEEGGGIKRLNSEPSDASGKFKLKKQGEGFVLQTASGKFVAAPKERVLSLADSPEGALVITIEGVK